MSDLSPSLRLVDPAAIAALPASAANHTLKVLLSAYACEPGRGSEPGVGWNTAREIAKYHWVWVLTSQTHQAAIEAELTQRPIANLQIIYCDPGNWIYDWSREGQKAQWDVHVHYYLWQLQAYRIARTLHAKVGLDLVHHVTYVKYSSPSFLCLLPLPFVWGPVGGGESAPTAFQPGLSLQARIYEWLRQGARRVGELDPFVHLTARRSAIAWATTEETAHRLKRLGTKDIQIFSQVGLNQEEIQTLAALPPASVNPPRLISIGRLLHWKGFHLGLTAFAQATLPDSAEYWIVGTGPEAQRLQALAQDLGITDRVKFWQQLSRAETWQRLGDCLALVHPSLHESGGLVCLEAMAAGRPVLCLDLGGPGIQVTPETGCKITADHPEQVIRDLAQAMTNLVQHPDLGQRMGQAAQQRVRESFSWLSKGAAISQKYAQIQRQFLPAPSSADSSG